MYSLGGWTYVLWGIPVRIMVVYHLTWCINSVCHTWGAKPFEHPHEARNNRWLGWIAFGEGWHNNHHAFPTSARHGMFGGQFDLTWSIIRILEKLRLAKNIKLPHLHLIKNPT